MIISSMIVIRPNFPPSEVCGHPMVSSSKADLHTCKNRAVFSTVIIITSCIYIGLRDPPHYNIIYKDFLAIIIPSLHMISKLPV